MPRHPAIWLAFAALVTLAALAGGSAGVRERAFDVLLQTTPAPGAAQVMVVAIDRAALDLVGPWPWPRDRLAGLIVALGADRPRAIALDMVLQGPGRAAGPADPDAALAAAVAAYPVVLGALMEGEEGDGPPASPPPVLVSGAPAGLDLWASERATWPLARLADAAAGVGIASLAGDGTGTIREVPLLLAVNGKVSPGLAAEAVRVAEGAEAYIVTGRTGALRPSGRIDIGHVRVALPQTGTVRVRPSGPDDWAARTVSAAEVIGRGVAAGTFAGRVVLVGGTAPELGTLRPTAASPVTPAVQVQADAVAAMLAGTAPLRPDFAAGAEAVARGALAALGLVLGRWLAPARAVAAALGGAGLWVAGCVLLLSGGGWLIDPASPAAVLVVAVLAAAIGTAVVTRRDAARVAARFRQHLAPAIVDRIVQAPGPGRVARERRVVTFLFTDLEGFSAMAARSPPETLAALLDDYFHGITSIVARHGGTVDKYVGDAVHAMFNAPLDLDDHATRAIEAGLDIHRFTEAFRRRDAYATAGVGRTRIGIETGEVVIGDVGRGARLDYTAHGTAINTAARLEALNARLGTAICVGPVARAAAPSLRFVSLGVHELKGLGPVEVFEPRAD